MKKIHLICNAHLDPVWLWRWDEGLGEALSTFRIAADFCENYEGFVFNHNEALLYEWVEEYEPALFERIRKLVAEGRWHIMGGWYLQPDCNMPSGESFIRQILHGREYFNRKFGAAPRTAINFDPFGHTRGLVQIMAKSGYDSYIFCRPDISIKDLPGEDFIWKGFDGSTVTAHRSYRFYLSQRGKAVAKIAEYLEKYPDKSPGMVLWGIGNHGGGPSREDLEAINRLRDNSEVDYLHSTPEKYFDELKKSGYNPDVVEESLNPFAVGCYTSQIRIKQKHRLLENELYSTEKMVSAANAAGLMEYDRDKLVEAQKDLMFCEFHDILPGSSIQVAEEDALRTMDHGLEILSKLKTKAFFMMMKGQEVAEDRVLPIFAYNPHPWPVKGVFECEFMNEFNSTKEKFSVPHMTCGGRQVQCQDEKEASNLCALDWRKKVVFRGTLEASAMTRFDLTLEALDEKPEKSKNHERDGKLYFENAEMRVVLNKSTGLLDSVETKAGKIIGHDAFMPVVMKDNADAWGMKVKSFRDRVGRFSLMSPREAADFAAVEGGGFEPVRIVEEGPVRTVVESYLKYDRSSICITYMIPAEGASMQIGVRAYWNQPDRMLKLDIPAAFTVERYMGQTACGTQELATDGSECVAHKWVAAVSGGGKAAVSVINDCIYGSSFEDGKIRLTLLRSPAYSGHPFGDKPVIEDDRYTPRVDMGERNYSFRIDFGTTGEVLGGIDRKALEFNEKPMVLTAYPSGEGRKPVKLIEMEGEDVILQAFKKAEDGEGYIMRLFNGADAPRKTKLSSPLLGFEEEVEAGAFEIATYRITGGNIMKNDLVEKGELK